MGLVALERGVPPTPSPSTSGRSARARRSSASPLDGIWVQHMFDGDRELLVTAFRDREFGVMVGCGIGGGVTELVDDVVFARAPIDARRRVRPRCDR